MKRVKKFLILLLLLYSQNTLSSQSEIEKLVVSGLDKCYNFHWQQAEIDFDKIISKFPEDPRGYHYKSSIYLWYYLDNKSSNDYNEFIKYSDLAIEIGLEYLDAEPDNAKILYVLGSDYSYRAIAFIKAEDYVSAVWASKKSDTYLNRSIEINPQNFDAYLGIGLYNFAMSQIPSAFKWALNLAGISGDRDSGLVYIKTTAAKGTLAKTEAQYYISQILSEVLFDYEAAEKYLTSLTKKYPGNLLFNYSLAVLELKRRNMPKAEKILFNINRHSEEKFIQIMSFSKFLMGDINFRQNEYEKAVDYYLQFLHTTPDNDYTGIASFRLGLCYELLGNRNKAVEYFRKSKNGNMDLDDDIFAKRKGEIYSKRTLADNEMSLIYASNLIESAQYQAAYDSLVSLNERLKSEKLKSEVIYYLSEAAYGLHDYESSQKYALQVKNLYIEEEWVKPFSYFNAARAAYKLGNKDAAGKFLNYAEDSNNYDYHNKLKNLIYAFFKKE